MVTEARGFQYLLGHQLLQLVYACLCDMTTDVTGTLDMSIQPGRLDCHEGEVVIAYQRRRLYADTTISSLS